MHQSDGEGLKQNLKAVRNRIYAQRSRQRHRNYVSCLEQERQLLLARLERLEQENREMRSLLLLNKKKEEEEKEVIVKNPPINNQTGPLQTTQMNSSSPVFSLDLNHFVGGELDAPSTTFTQNASPLVTSHSPLFLGSLRESIVNDSVMDWMRGVRLSGCSRARKAFQKHQMTWRISSYYP